MGKGVGVVERENLLDFVPTHYKSLNRRKELGAISDRRASVHHYQILKEGKNLEN